MRDSRLAFGVFQFHFASEYVGVPRREGHQIIQPEVVNPRIADASDARQCRGRLHFDHALEWPPELPAQSMSAGVVVKTYAWTGSLRSWNTSLVQSDPGNLTQGSTSTENGSRSSSLRGPQ